MRPARTVSFPLLAASLFAACGTSAPEAALDADRAAAIRDSVAILLEAIAHDLSDGGPMAWLGHFEETPAFFMSSDGAILFPTADSAATFVRGLARRYTEIELEWIDVRIEPVGPGLAVVGASYEETLTDIAGAELDFAGYVTALARHGADGWRLQHLHWSSPTQEGP